MPKQDSFDYLKAMLDFDKPLGRKRNVTDLPLKYSTTTDGGVDYLAISKEYEKYLIESNFVISSGKK